MSMLRHYDYVPEVEPASEPSLVILHGLLGTGRNWHSLAQHLGQERRVHCLDLRNHGHSFHAPEMSYAHMAEDVAAFITARVHEPVALIGHSMGGKVAMTLALTQAQHVAGLMVVDIAPRPYRRDYRPYIEAMQAIDLGSIDRREEVTARLAQSVDDPAVRALLLRNLGRHHGAFVWHPNLSALAEHMDALMDFPAVTESQRYDGPCRFVAGEKSDYITESDWPGIARLFPQARLETVDGAGHWVHADQPETMLARIETFLDALASEPDLKV